MPPEQIRRIALGGVIAVVAAWAGMAHLAPVMRPQSAQAAQRPAIPDFAAELKLSEPAVEPLIARVRSELVQAAWPTNPFFRWQTAVDEAGSHLSEVVRAPARGPTLTAIVRGPRPLAIIDGVIVSVGDRLADGAAVLAIDPYSVTVEGTVEPRVLRLPDR